MKRTSSPASSAGAAKSAIDFFKLLHHVKGKWAGDPFVLEDWQRDEIIVPLFGTLRPDGKRQYRTAYIEVPRKNGKSTLAAGIALYLLFGDNEPGAEVYSCAADREQAAIVFGVAKGMVESSPALRGGSTVYGRSIVYPKFKSSYKVLSADAYTKHGLNASGIVFDELHAQPNRELWDVMTTSTGAREQPLMVAITTAGWDRNSICWEQHQYAEKVAAGIVDDPSFFSYIRAAGPKDDYRAEATWRKANPALGVTVSLDYFKQEAARAAEVPAYQNTFRRLHLNQWTEQSERWLDMAAWDRTAGIVVPHELRGRECYAGLDLASTSDVAALALVFPSGDDYQVLTRFWIPEAAITMRSRRDRVPYDAWARDGLLTTTEGDEIDYGTIRRDIEALGKQYDIREIAYDRAGATQLAQDLTGAGFQMVPITQGFAGMAGPTKELLHLILGKRLRHGGNPVLRWMASNVAVKQDSEGNVRPNKSKSTEKIDGIVALVMAIGRAIANEGGAEWVAL